MSCGAQGALLQVQVQSNLDLWLTVNPECTFFQQDVCRHSPFAIAESDVAPSSTVRWGQILQFEIPRAGDLLGALFLRLKVRGLRKGPAYPVGIPAIDDIVQWVNTVGYAGISKATLEIGQIIVDQKSGELMELLEQYRSSPGNEQGAAIGTFDNANDLREWSYNDQIMYVALHFFMFEHPEMYLPIIALSAHAVRVKVYLNDKYALINAQNGSGVPVDASLANVLDATYNGDLVDAALTTRMVFLDQFERNLISAEVHELVILQHQGDASEAILAGTTTKAVTLSFNNAVLALITRWRADSSTARSNFNTKDYFRYDVLRPAAQQAPFGGGTMRTVPFDEWQIKFNGTDRVCRRDSVYFTEVTPFLHAVKKAKGRAALLYSFHMAPFSDYHTPAGHAQFSRIHEVKSQAFFKTDGGGVSVLTETGTWDHLCLSYNVLRIAVGQALVKFS